MSSSTNGAEKTGKRHTEQCNGTPISHHSQALTWEGSRIDTVQLLEENTRDSSVLVLATIIFGHDTKSTNNESKNQQKGLHQTQKLLQKNKQNGKTAYRIKENFPKLFLRLGVNVQNT